ncbi:MAG: hypothetical protein WAQ05_03025, partial [Rubrivivax sp.]
MTPADDSATGFTSFPAIIAAHARAQPAATAFQVDAHRLDWQSLAQRSGQIAGALVRSGLAPGERVALLGP